MAIHIFEAFQECSKALKRWNTVWIHFWGEGRAVTP